jgi:hypothetical protein
MIFIDVLLRESTNVAVMAYLLNYMRKAIPYAGRRENSVSTLNLHLKVEGLSCKQPMRLNPKATLNKKPFQLIVLELF